MTKSFYDSVTVGGPTTQFIEAYGSIKERKNVYANKLCSITEFIIGKRQVMRHENAMKYHCDPNMNWPTNNDSFHNCNYV